MPYHVSCKRFLQTFSASVFCKRLMTRSNATRFDLVLFSSPPFRSADSTIASSRYRLRAVTARAA